MRCAITRLMMSLVSPGGGAPPNIRRQRAQRRDADGPNAADLGLDGGRIG
jgi:hypothetical protein